MLQRDISSEDVECVLLNGEIIEEYPDDYPSPSVLLMGVSLHGRYLHVVCGVAEEALAVVTAYEPDPDQWEEDRKTRKKVSK